MPDIIGIWEGKPLAIEVKSTTGKLSDHQKKFQQDWTDHGGIHITANSLDDVIQVLTAVDKSKIG